MSLESFKSGNVEALWIVVKGCAVMVGQAVIGCGHVVVAVRCEVDGESVVPLLSVVEW
jgi:hypothetical protein